MSENNESINEVMENEEKPVMKRNPMLRVAAWILLIGYLFLLGLVVYMVVTGSRYIFAMIFILIMYPLILYLMIWLRKTFGNK